MTPDEPMPGETALLTLEVVPSARMLDGQREDVIRLCGSVFNIDFAYLIDLCPLRTHVLGYLRGELVAHALWLDRWERWQGRLWIDSQGEWTETLDETVLVYRTRKTRALNLTADLTAEWRPFALW